MMPGQEITAPPRVGEFVHCATARRNGGRSGCAPTAGFTLVELLLVIVILGLLAAIAIPKFANTKEKAYDAAVVSDLRSAFVAIEADYADNQAYPPTLADTDFQPSPGVTFTRWDLENGGSTVHIHAEHAQSRHLYHTKYPSDPLFDQRNK